MPYIKHHQRLRHEAFGVTPDTSGELNYIIARYCQEYAKSHGSNYDAYNEVIGALECAKLEFYRRLVAVYEEKKMAENGDVY